MAKPKMKGNVNPKVPTNCNALLFCVFEPAVSLKVPLHVFCNKEFTEVTIPEVVESSPVIPVKAFNSLPTQLLQMIFALDELLANDKRSVAIEADVKFNPAEDNC